MRCTPRYAQVKLRQFSANFSSLQIFQVASSATSNADQEAFPLLYGTTKQKGFEVQFHCFTASRYTSKRFILCHCTERECQSARACSTIGGQLIGGMMQLVPAPHWQAKRDFGASNNQCSFWNRQRAFKRQQLKGKIVWLSDGTEKTHGLHSGGHQQWFWFIGNEPGKLPCPPLVIFSRTSHYLSDTNGSPLIFNVPSTRSVFFTWKTALAPLVSPSPQLQRPSP